MSLVPEQYCCKWGTIALHAIDGSSISDTPSFPPNLPGVISECRLKNKPKVILDVTQTKEKYIPNMRISHG